MESKSVKVYSAQDIKCDEGKREVVSIINTAAIDREGEVIQPKGMKKKDFQGNPVVFANHSYLFDPKALPIGYSKWVKSGTDENGNDVIIAKSYITDKTQDGRDVFGLIQDGVIKACSIGFEPLRASKPSTTEKNLRPELEKCKNIVREWNLLEYSFVGLPCNQEALALAVSKGYSPKIINMISGKSENTLVTAKAVIETIEQEPAYVENKISQKELCQIIGNGIDKAVKSIDADAIMRMALKRLVK